MASQVERPLKGKSIEDLIHMYDKKCIEQQRLCCHGSHPPLDPVPSTLLKPGASQEQIDHLRDRFRQLAQNPTDDLPKDYVEFLKLTNGIYIGDVQTESSDSMFSDTDHVEVEEDKEGLFLCELLSTGNNDIDIAWPELGSCLKVGAGGDEGNLWLVPSTTTKKALEAFMDCYWDANAEDRKTLEDSAKKIYGSVSEMRKMEHACFRFYHWAADLEAFASFKHLLEDFVLDTEDTPQNSDNEDNDNDDGEEAENDGEDAKEQVDGRKPPKPKSAKPSNTVPKGKSNALKDLKIIFTGTFDMDRKTCEATAKQYGAKIITKLENADYIVLGLAAGPKKLETILEKGLKTIDQQGFFDLIQGKSPQQTEVKNDEDNKITAGKGASAAKVFASRTGKAAEAKKTVPKGKPDALAGLKILFTGTLETMDRTTAKKAAEAHGAKVITKLEDTDFIVLGVKAGPKKLEEIENKGLKTISEAEFGDLLGKEQDGEPATAKDTKGAKKRGKKGGEIPEPAQAPANKRSKKGQ